MDVDSENQGIATEGASSTLKVGTPQPLQPISSERQNQQRIPQSSSVPFNLDGSGSPRKSIQHRLSDAADVRARVAYLNAISQPNSPARSSSPTKMQVSNLSNAAIQRAILGREEAEGALTALASQLESAKARERLVSERVESLMDQLSEARQRQKHERAVYEKEIRQSKKTEYKAELAVIKLQEDLREARSELEGYKVRSEHDKAEKEKAKQDAFERAYVVAGMTEEIQELKSRLEVTGQERDAAVAMAASKMPIQEENTHQVQDSHEHVPREKRKQPTSDFDLMSYDDQELEAVDCPIEIKYAALQKEADYLKRQIREDAETIHFMNMQCQFKACPCRLAERDGVRFVHDYEYDAKVRARNAKKRKVEELQPQAPLPVFRSWRREQEESKGKQPLRENEVVYEATAEKVHTNFQGQETAVSQEAKPVIEEPSAPLPPADVPVDTHMSNTQSAMLDEAMNVPLPTHTSMEVDSSDETIEPTAQLEELTQVVVEPGNSANNFLFSTSTTSHKAVTESAPTFRQSHNVRISDDLFDISPPKRQMPPRPSTAMGVLTVDSPIRLVPHSPHMPEKGPVSSMVELAQPMTTRVALNDTSPVRQSRQQRQNTRPGVSSQSRGRSPAPLRTAHLDRSSPAPSTLFPITPATKTERGNIQQVHVEPRPHTAQGYYGDSLTEISTTTTVPLRGDSEQRDETLSSEQSGPSSSTTPFCVPGTPNMTREAALAQIRARRDRARSINMRKSAEEGSKTPGSAARRGVNLKDRLGDVKGRDFSQASAPGRM